MNTFKAKQLFTDLIRQLDEIKTIRDENKRDAFSRRIDMLIRQFFEDSSEYLRDLQKINWYGMYDETDYEKNKTWGSGWHKSLNLINTILEEIEIQEAESKESQQSAESKLPLTNKVFVVHGHDETMKQAVARVLEKLKLESIILHEKPNQGRTIIEKFSDYSDVSFAVVLLSPDDIGYPKDKNSENGMLRARQNVILELGFFLGKLGRARVVALLPPEERFEFPTDYSGILYIPFDSSGKWQYDLVRELKACGFNVDANILVE